MVEITEREREILEMVNTGINSPTELAAKLHISQSGASQALQRLAEKGKLVRRRGGRVVRYETPHESRDSDLIFLSQAYNALSQVWAYVMSMTLPREELQRARAARETLEGVLARRKE